MKQMLIRWDAADPAGSWDSLRTEYEGHSWSCLLFHIFSGEASEEQVMELVAELRSEFPGAEIVGTISAGEILDGRLMEDGILVSAMLFESSSVEVHRFENVNGDEQAVGEQIRDMLEQIPEVKGAEVLLDGSELDTRILFGEIEQCEKHIRIFGGYSGGHTLAYPEHFVFDREGILRRSILVITYAGRELSIDTDRTVGWKTLGASHQITKADGNWIYEIDQHPAVDIYKSFLQIEGEGTADDALEFPLMMKVHGEDVLRGIVFIDQKGALMAAGRVTEGMEVQLSYGNPSDIVQCVNVRLEALRRFQPQVLLLYSCLARKTFWGEFVDMEMVPFETLCSTAGWHTWGEVERSCENGNIFEYNLTMLSIAMREGPCPVQELPPVRVDDSVLHGQASIMRSLTVLVSSVTNELQQAYQNMEKLNNELTCMNERLQVMADYDALTEIYNRGKIETVINKTLDTASHSDEPVSLVMLDIDRFKLINDNYGHGVGDKALQTLAELLREAAGSRPNTEVGRWGGEEFFVMLPGADRSEALAFSQKLHRRIEQYDFPDIGRMTVSMGVITTRGDQERKEIFKQVDDALYQAKKTGRNRIVQC